jgi:hypothetical protein
MDTRVFENLMFVESARETIRGHPKGLAVRFPTSLHVGGFPTWQKGSVENLLTGWGINTKKQKNT